MPKSGASESVIAWAKASFGYYAVYNGMSVIGFSVWMYSFTRSGSSFGPRQVPG